ncbi:Starch-binding associating with outer membrane [Chitinophaga costaii]|uniref:Starch-binding associating with outer membrane n=1 Tax=Chitinophaga costaii TaxID=1335309 RepID=A0A1C3YSC4_9BACT|nr:SusD/RagB family nutrient-binding outer membrane lipoprotein [Chitinophaga costaii]PUZ30084.1 SusD/RagB family nutrient-binding outer membrane lipoprotein [Chitinophaga costaii]SCB72973.1 Starch-binding associating with outer membrane [Chitinophaga costaii]
MKQTTIKYFIITSICLMAAACTKNFDEMNTDPNKPTTAPSTNVLANSTYSIAATLFGERLGIFYEGFYAGHTAPGIAIAASYEYRDEIVAGHWSSLYYAMNDLQKIVDQSAADGSLNMQAVALTLKVYAAQYLTDMWGDVPYTEAFKGEEGVTRPAYNTQEEVYNAMFTELETAANLFTQNAIDGLGGGDILLGGDVKAWQRFCNSLRLRLAIRISGVAPDKAASVLKSVLDNSADYPTLNEDENVSLKWVGASPYNDPWYTYLTSSANYYAMCSTVIDTLKAYNDPRLPVYAQRTTLSDPANPGLNDYAGLKSGEPSSSFSVSTVSKIGVKFGYTAAGFSPFMRYSEICFIKAEALLKGLITSGNAESEYQKGIIASMKENGITDYSAYLAKPSVAWSGTSADLTKVYLQKWLAIFKESAEAWSETRRTDVPVMSAVPYDYHGSHNRPPFRYPYPNSELTLNGENISEHLTGLDNNDYFWGKQVWWDTRTGVH